MPNTPSHLFKQQLATHQQRANELFSQLAGTTGSDLISLWVAISLSMISNIFTDPVERKAFAVLVSRVVDSDLATINPDDLLSKQTERTTTPTNTETTEGPK